MWTGSARTRQSGCAYSPPPIPSLPPPRSQKLRESGGQRRLPVIGICEPGRGDLPEQHDEIIRGPLKHPARHRSPGPGRSSRPSTAPATTTPAALPSGHPPKAPCQPHHRHRRNVLAARTATRRQAGLPHPRSPQASPGTSASPVPAWRAWPNSCTPVPTGHPARPTPPSSQPPSASSSPARPPWTCAISRPSTPPHTAALNLLPQTPTAQPARHLTEQPNAPPQNLNTLGSPNSHYVRLLLPGAGPTEACRSR